MSLDQVVSTFKRFNIGAEELEPGHCEIGALVPRTDIDMLGELGRELEQLDKIFGIFAELTVGTRPGFQIRSISSSDFNLFWDMMPMAAASAVFAIERIVTIYKNMLEIRKLHGELKKQGVPAKNIKGVLDHSNATMKDGIQQLTKELIEKYYKKNDEGRRNELTTELQKSLTGIAKRIDKGYNLEVRAAPLPEDEQGDAEGKMTSEERDYIKSILAASKNLEFLKLEGDSILSLMESQDDQKDDQ